MSRFKLSDPKVGNRYWWVNVINKEPVVMDVTSISNGPNGNGTITFKMTWYGDSQVVSWTMKEWEAAKGRIADYEERVTTTSCAKDEEPCDMCNGTRWERTRDSDVIPCIWCNAIGKRKKIEEQKPKRTRRSNMHPEL